LYSSEDHIHNFACWTAARASQRGFATTDDISKAINKSGLRTLAFKELPAIKDQEEYDSKHTRICKKIEDLLKESHPQKATFGRAAKIVAIYLKTAVVIPNITESFISFIHPPIDRILLENIKKKEQLIDTVPAWTQFTKKEYYVIWNKIKGLGEGQNWMIEKYWQQ